MILCILFNLFYFGGGCVCMRVVRHWTWFPGKLWMPQLQSAQGQGGQSSCQSGLVEDVPAQSRGSWASWALKLLSNPIHSMTLCFQAPVSLEWMFGVQVMLNACSDACLAATLACLHWACCTVCLPFSMLCSWLWHRENLLPFLFVAFTGKILKSGSLPRQAAGIFLTRDSEKNQPRKTSDSEMCQTIYWGFFQSGISWKASIVLTCQRQKMWKYRVRHQTFHVYILSLMQMFD